jgi:hypothetical protein
MTAGGHVEWFSARRAAEYLGFVYERDVMQDGATGASRPACVVAGGLDEELERTHRTCTLFERARAGTEVERAFRRERGER